MSDEPSEQDVDREFYKMMSLVKGKEFEAALDLCHHHIEHWPSGKRHHAFGWLAHVHEAMKNKVAAMEAVTTALELAPAWVPHLDQRMLLAIDAGGFPMAIHYGDTITVITVTVHIIDGGCRPG